MRNTIIVIWFFYQSFCVGQLMSSQTLNLRAELTSTGVKVDDPLSKQQIENLSVLGKNLGLLEILSSCCSKRIPTILTPASFQCTAAHSNS